MTTLDDRQADAHARYIASLLTPGKVRRSALSCIVIGDTAELLRKLAGRRLAGLEALWLAWAGEVELLTAHGVTGRTAREAAKIALVVSDATAADFRHPMAHRDSPETRRRLLMVADEMDALTAEGFDPAIYEKEIEQACGGAR